MKKLRFFLYLTLFALVVSACKSDDIDDPKPDPLKPLETQARVQVAFDDNDVAFKFVWKSQKKTLPAGVPSNGLNYPGIFHDMLKHNGEKFDRLASAQRLQEDRVSFTIDDYNSQIAGFAKANCAMTCHTDMARHHLLTDNTLDHWHWRGGRSGPMGYAEDAAINNVERIRDNVGTAPTKFIRSGGDRFRENQPALTGTGHGVLIDGFPRFVFNKGKTVGSYVVPNYFLSNESNQVITDPYSQIPQVKDAGTNRSLLVIYQDRQFDNVEKVNALDLAYLAWLALDETTHLPAHLQDVGSNDFNAWKAYWETESGVSTQAAALAKLNEIHAEWIASGKNAMVTHSVGFIYNSDQHDIVTESSYDANRNEWTVIMKRKLSTGSDRDADLSGLPAGTKYSFSFAMHDKGGAAATHDISLPLVVSTEEEADIQAMKVASINQVDWDMVPVHDTYWVKQSALDKYKLDYLRDGAHPGASAFETMKCTDCHKDDKSLLTPSVLN